MKKLDFSKYHTDKCVDEMDYETMVASKKIDILRAALEEAINLRASEKECIETEYTTTLRWPDKFCRNWREVLRDCVHYRDTGLNKYAK
jgi:hypothetical protein